MAYDECYRGAGKARRRADVERLNCQEHGSINSVVDTHEGMQ